MISTPQITSSRIPTQQTTSHSLRGRTGRERHDIEADVNEGCPLEQADTDCDACNAPRTNTSPLPNDKTVTSHSEHLYKLPTLPETSTQLMVINRRTPMRHYH